MCGICSGKGFVIMHYEEARLGAYNYVHVCSVCNGKGTVYRGVQTCVKCGVYFDGEHWEKHCDTCLRDYLNRLLNKEQ